VKISFLAVLEKGIDDISRANVSVWVMRIAQQNGSDVTIRLFCCCSIGANNCLCRTVVLEGNMDGNQLDAVPQHRRYLETACSMLNTDSYIIVLEIFHTPHGRKYQDAVTVVTQVIEQSIQHGAATCPGNNMLWKYCNDWSEEVIDKSGNGLQ
jgi:hypothetical protein